MGSLRTRRSLAAIIVTAAAVSLATVPGAGARSNAHRQPLHNPFRAAKHIVVIYEENHSFDNLYGGWEHVNGLPKADAPHTTQVDQGGTAYGCLAQNEINLASEPATCNDSQHSISSNFPNQPFKIDRHVNSADSTCPKPGTSAPNGVLKGQGQPGGCTADLVHRYYQEQYQLDGGKQDRYTTGSDAIGLTQGFYDTSALPIYGYLHGDGHPHYAIADNFFQGAFGGSFLNHQWLVAAATPVWANADNSGGSNDLHSVVDTNGMPTGYPLYTPTLPKDQLKDQQLTASCTPGPGRAATPPGAACGDFAVNTSQPWYQPFAPGTADARRLPPLTNPNIGDRLNDAKVDWAWYSGGWSNADGDVSAPGWTNGAHGGNPANGDPNGCPDPNAAARTVWPNCPDKLFQFHHQPLNYFADMAPGTENRRLHLRDEQEFIANALADKCQLKPVSFVKPIGAENEHPGYAAESTGSTHLIRLLEVIEDGACAKNTIVLVTYDEFGGTWDHVPPPGQGGAAGPHDQWGPGTRIPALVVSKLLSKKFTVDHTQYDTTSVLATIEKRYGLKPLATRDAAVNSLAGLFPPRRGPLPR